MKKKISLLMLSVLCSLLLFGCGKNKAEELGIDPDKYDELTAEGVVASIESDFEKATQDLNNEVENIKASMGTTFDEFVGNKQNISDWYVWLEDETESLLNTLNEKTIDYFKVMAYSLKNKEVDDANDAMTTYDDKIYNGVVNDFYMAYTEAMTDIYTTYSEIISQSYDAGNYDELMKEAEDFNTAYQEAGTLIYDTWNQGLSSMYDNASAIAKGLASGEYDIDKILGENGDN